MHDLVLRGGTVFDGLGNEPVEGDVAVRGDRVVAVGTEVGAARRVIDVSGHYVAPGFVDAHAHSDHVPLMSAAQPFKLLQGVTTEIVGNCGFSLAPLDPAGAEQASALFGDLGGEPIASGSFASYLERIEDAGPTNNMAALVGHNTLRLAANGMRETLGSDALATMKRLADESFAAGAAGLSTGLLYVPGSYAATGEVVELAHVARRHGRPYATHLRDEGPGLEAALDEAITIGRRAGVRVQISHCKASGRSSHGMGGVLREKLAVARRDGIDIRGDQYPYTAGSTFLSALLPGAAHAGGAAELLRRLLDPGERALIRSTAEVGGFGNGLWAQARPKDVLIGKHADEAVVGRTLDDLASADDPFDVLCDLIVRDPAAMMVIDLMEETDVLDIMSDPLIGIGSDNDLPFGLVHPRTVGCFPRFFGAYVREREVVGWAEGIRKASYATAAQFDLVGRGWLGAGAVADVTVLDPVTVGHAGGYLDPWVRPTGIQIVVLNGVVVVEDGEFTGGRHGRVLRAGRGPRVPR